MQRVLARARTHSLEMGRTRTPTSQSRRERKSRTSVASLPVGSFRHWPRLANFQHSVSAAAAFGLNSRRLLLCARFHGTSNKLQNTEWILFTRETQANAVSPALSLCVCAAEVSVGTHVCSKIPDALLLFNCGGWWVHGETFK